MTELLFNSWWLPVVVILAGVAVWVGGNRRTDSRVRRAGIAFAALGALLLAGTFLFETPNKRVTRQSKELVKSIVDQDWAKLQSLLDPHVTLSVSEAALYRSRDDLLKAAKEGTQKYGLRGASADVEDVRKAGPILTTTVKVFVNADNGPGHPVPTTWQFDWERDEGGAWTARDIRCIDIGGGKGGDPTLYLPHVR